MTPFSGLFLNSGPLADSPEESQPGGLTEAGLRRAAQGLPQPSPFFVLLSQDAPYLDLAPYMPDYYKPQYLLDFEDPPQLRARLGQPVPQLLQLRHLHQPGVG